MNANKPIRRAMFMVIAGGLILAACATPTAEPTVMVESTIPVPPTEAPPATSVPVAVFPTAAAGEPAAVASLNTYIYGGPGTNYVVYGAFLGGTSARVVGRAENGAWWAVSVPPAPGEIGWVDGTQVSVSSVDGVPTLPTPPVPPTTALVPPAPGDPQATALVNTFVRTGPGASFPAFGVAEAGASGRLIGVSQDGLWWVARLDPAVVGTGYGWVPGETVQASNTDGLPVIESPAPPNIQPPPPPPAGAPSATAIEYVNVRSGPGTCYPAYFVAAPGATGEVIGKSGDGQWWQVRLPAEVAASGNGWAAAGYVTTANTGSVPTVPAEPCSNPGVPPPNYYACILKGQSPLDYSALAPGAAFDMTWTVTNTGSTPWTKNVGNFVQAGQTGKLHTGADSVGPLADDIQYGKSLTLTVPAVAPSKSGTYGELWEVNANGTVVCQFWMIIQVP